MQRPTVDQLQQFISSLDLLYLALIAAAVLVFAVSAKRVTVGPAVRGVPNRLFWPAVLVGAWLARIPVLMQSLWYDETFTARMAFVGGDNFITALLGDVHPPGYYLLARLSTSLFGRSDVMLRFPAFLGGLLLIYLVYRLSMLLTQDRRVSQLAAFITAFLPAMIYYSAEARYPTLLACLVLLALIALLDERPAMFSYPAGCVAWFHSAGMLYVAVLVLLALARKERRWTLAAVGAAIVAALWLPGLLMQAGDVIDGFWLSNVFPLWPLVEMTMRKAVPVSPLLLLTWLTPILLTLFGLWTSRRWLVRREWLAIAFGVPALLWLVSVLWQPVYLSRVLIAPVLLIVIAWAWFLVRSPSRWRAVLMVALLAGVGVSNAEQYANDRTDIDDVFAHCDGAKYVYTTSTNITIMAMSYVEFPARVVSWPAGDNLNQTLPSFSKRAMNFQYDPLTSLNGEVCLVYLLNYNTTDREAAFLALIDDQYQPETVFTLSKDGLFNYVVKRFTL